MVEPGAARSEPGAARSEPGAARSEPGAARSEPGAARSEPGGLDGARAPRGHDDDARLGVPRVHLRRCDSTNERARALALAGAPHGILVTADEQTAGRGRQGRSWEAPAGSCLLCSLVLRGQRAAPPATLLPLIAGVALCDAIGAGALLKWPNDVVLAGPGPAAEQAGAGAGPPFAKVAGILVEGRPQEEWAVVGIGVNVAVSLHDLPEQVRSRAATLGRPATAIEPLLAELLAALATRLAEPPESALERWRALDALRGREIAWPEGSGRAEGVDGEGRLLVRLAGGGTARLQAGEIHLASSA